MLSSPFAPGPRSVTPLPPDSDCFLPHILLENLRSSHNWEDMYNWFDAFHPWREVPGEWERFKREVEGRIWKPDPSRFVDLSIAHVCILDLSFSHIQTNCFRGM